MQFWWLVIVHIKKNDNCLSRWNIAKDTAIESRLDAIPLAIAICPLSCGKTRHEPDGGLRRRRLRLKLIRS